MQPITNANNLSDDYNSNLNNIRLIILILHDHLIQQL